MDGVFGDAACPADAALARALLDACVVTLTGDVTGNGKCAGKALGALGAGGRGLGGCSARDAIDPGKGAACEAGVVSRLDPHS